MRHRIALVVGILAASGTLAVALAAAGLGPAEPALVSSAVTPAPTSRVQVDTIYLPAPADPPTITVHRVLPTNGESDDGASEGPGADD